MRDKKPILQMCRESIHITISNDTNDRWNSIVRDEKNKIKLMSSKNSKKGKGRQINIEQHEPNKNREFSSFQINYIIFTIYM